MLHYCIIIRLQVGLKIDEYSKYYLSINLVQYSFLFKAEAINGALCFSSKFVFEIRRIQNVAKSIDARINDIFLYEHQFDIDLFMIIMVHFD